MQMRSTEMSPLLEKKKKKKYRGRKIIDGNDVVGRAHCTLLGCSAAAEPYPSAGRVPPHVGLKNKQEGRGTGNNYPNKRVLARCWARFNPSLWFAGKCGQYYPCGEKSFS